MDTERRYFCPCCGSDNTSIASIDKVVDVDDASSTWKSVSIWCHNCPEPIHIAVEVSNDFEPANAPYNIMDPLQKYLKNLKK